MIKTRRDFIRLTVVVAGSAALGAAVQGCGPAASGTDAGTGGGSGGGTGGGTGGGAGGGTGGSTDAGSGGGTGGSAGSTCSTNGAHDTAITFNHGHSLLVPAADFTASGDKIYDIKGASLHSHTITLTAAQRATILGGTSVTVTSTTTDHSHDVTVACA